jgi:hypothetical protein
VIGQILTNRFAKLLDRIVTSRFDLSTKSFFGVSVRRFTFVYAKLSASLLRGGVLWPFESKFGSLIAVNLAAPNRPDFVSTAITRFRNEELNDFLNAQDSPVLATIYTKWKPGNHHKLSPELQDLDKLILVTLAVSLCQLNLLLHVQAEVRSALKPLLEQILRIRNNYRHTRQRCENAEPIKHSLR